MKDMISIIRDKLLANDALVKLTGKRISKYSYPESADHTQLFVVISPLGPPEVQGGGSDRPLFYEFTYQINVESKTRTKVREAQHLIQDEMLSLNFAQMSGGLDEFFEETQRFVDARRYRGNSQLYDTDY